MRSRLSSLARHSLVTTVVVFASLAAADPSLAADKGKVKDIGDGGDGLVEVSGTGEVLPFVQPFVRQMGITVGSVVRFETVMPGGQSRAVAVVLRLQGAQYPKGIVVSRASDRGVVADARTGRQYSFTQPFSTELGLAAGDGVTFFVVPGGGAVLTSIVNTSRSNIKQIALQLDGGGMSDVAAVEGGQLVPGYTFVNSSPFVYARQPGKPKYEDITLRLPFNPDRALAAWITETVDGKTWKTRSGSVVVFDDEREVARLSFRNALISEVRLPALDAASKDTAYLTVVITPGEAAMTSDAGFPLGSSFKVKIDAKKQKHFLSSNFRLRIDGLDARLSGNVTKIDSFTIRQHTAASGGFAGYVFADDPFTPGRELGLVLQSGMNVRTCEADLQQALRGIDVDRAVEVDYLNEFGDLLLTLRDTLGIVQCTPEKSEGNPDSLRMRLISNPDAPKLQFPG